MIGVGVCRRGEDVRLCRERNIRNIRNIATLHYLTLFLNETTNEHGCGNGDVYLGICEAREVAASRQMGIGC